MPNQELTNDHSFGELAETVDHLEMVYLVSQHQAVNILVQYTFGKHW